ncbi:MAG: HAD family hydrolase [Nitriliruptorales bacterium]
MCVRHVVFDWNQTLLDDTAAIVGAVNVCLELEGLPPITADDYKRDFVRPVHLYYERLFGRSIAEADWVRLDGVFRDAYWELLSEPRLAADAEVALARVATAGRTQSICSMHPHEELVALVGQLGVDHHFLRIDGLRGTPGGGKSIHLEAHLGAVFDGAPRDAVVVIGDSLDDAAAAEHAGARCVLYDGGSHPVEALEATGHPVVASLTAALDIAGIPA